MNHAKQATKQQRLKIFLLDLLSARAGIYSNQNLHVTTAKGSQRA